MGIHLAADADVPFSLSVLRAIQVERKRQQPTRTKTVRYFGLACAGIMMRTEDQNGRGIQRRLMLMMCADEEDGLSLDITMGDTVPHAGPAQRAIQAAEAGLPLHFFSSHKNIQHGVGGFSFFLGPRMRGPLLYCWECLFFSAFALASRPRMDSALTR
ncbi:hypothetical protein L209DRAFT_42685 [Thermothelomyces heterothallicus CBS 203.75]